jgi:hypothetical protein
MPIEIQNVYLQIEPVEDYNPVYKRVDCMRNPGHEGGNIPDSEVNARKVRALVYREYIDEYYINKKPDKLIITDTTEPSVAKRIGTVIYTLPGKRLKIHVRNADHEPHSFHIHGLSYGIDSDGAWPFGSKNKYGQRSDEICTAETWIYTFDVTADMIGGWAFHDHYRDIMTSVNLGLFGGLVVAPDESYKPPPFQIPSSLASTISGSPSPAATRKEAEPYIMELLNLPQLQPDVGPTDTIHAPIFFHVLGTEKTGPVFDTRIIGPGLSAEVTLNKPKRNLALLPLPITSGHVWNNQI